MLAVGASCALSTLHLQRVGGRQVGNRSEPNSKQFHFYRVVSCTRVIRLQLNLQLCSVK
jgi:hypothetical protein